MTYLEALTEARTIDALSSVTAAYVRRWNALEDSLQALPPIEVEAMVAEANAADAKDMGAHIILTMLEV
jgi:hypothetical protein